jgi:glycine C-acetyltransferase
VRVLRSDPSLPERLRDNATFFRAGLRVAGFEPLDGEAAIIPIIVGETAFAIRMSERLLDEGIFVTGFGHPVVPEGTARIRVQMSAALTREQLAHALDVFGRVGRELGLLA